MFPIFKISGNFPLVNARFIRRVRGVLRGFLNLLKSLFEMLKGPLLLLILSVVMYVIISSSEVKFKRLFYRICEKIMFFV